MSTESKDVELRIRARDYSQKTLDQLVDTLKELGEAQEQQQAAAKRGESSAKALEASYSKLEGAAKALISQHALTETFKRQSAALDQARSRTEAARIAQKEYSDSLAGNEAITKKQEAALAKLARAVTGAEKAQQRAEDTLTRTSVKMEKFGLSVEDVVGAQTKIVESVQAANVALERQETALNGLEDDLKRTAQAQRDLAETQAFEKAAADASTLVRASEYVRLWINALEEKEAAESKAAGDAKLLNEFRELGIASEQSAKGLRRGKAAVDELAVANAKAGDSVRALVDPNAVLVKTLDGLETALGKSAGAQAKFEADLKSLGKSAINAREEIAQLGRVQSAATGLASLVDRFTNIRAAAAGAAREFRETRAEVLQYAQAIRSADAPSDELVASLREAEGRLAAAQKRYETFGTAAAKLRGDLAAAGVNIRDMAGEVARLEGVASRATTASNALSAAMGRVSSSSNNAGNALGLFSKGERTTLSLMQRLRGEVLALTTTYVGLYGAIQGVQSVLDAVQTQAGIEARVGVAFGQGQVGAELTYLNEQAERLGINFKTAASEYSNLAIAAKSANFTIDETRFIFESFGEVSKVFRVSDDNLSGVFKALTQIMSKSKIQAEELRGQLGDRLSGAFTTLAESMSITAAELDEMIEAGNVPDDFLLLFAKRYRELVAGELPAATRTAEAEIARFNNAIYQLQLTIAEGGFLEAFTEATRKLTAFLKSEDGQAFAEKLGAALTKLTNGFIWLLDNIDGVTAAMKALAGVYVASKVLSFASAQATLATKLGETAKQAAGTQKAIAGIGSAMASLNAIGAAGAGGFAIGTWLYEESELVRGAANAMIGTIDWFVTSVTALYRGFHIEAVGMFEDNWSRIFNIVVKYVKLIVEKVAEVARGFGFDDFADNIISKVADIAEKPVLGLGARTKELRQELAKELTLIEGLIKDSFAAEERAAQGRAGAAPKVVAAGGQTGLDPAREKALHDEIQRQKDEADKESKKAAEKAAKERIKLETDVAEELARIDDDIAEQKALTIEEKLALIEREYRDLFVKLEKLGGPDSLVGRAKVDELIELRKKAEMEKLISEQKKAALDEIKKKEEEVNRLIEVRDIQIDAVNAKIDSGLMTELEGRKEIARIQEASNPSIITASQAVIDMIAAIKDPEARAALEAMSAKMGLVQTNARMTAEELRKNQVLEQWAEGGANIAMAFTDAVAATGDLSDGFRAARDAFRQFASDFLREIVMMILKQQLLNAMKSAGGVWGQAAGAVGGAVAHTGGVIGYTSLPQRNVDPRIFRGARRYHGGGFPGLRSDEVPAILQTGEEVLTRDDPRNAMNGGGGGGAAQPAQPAIVKIVNSFDSLSVVSDALNTQEGEQMVMNIVRKNS